ncbi:Hypothetical predicted protein, partial [Prunus dulcis]
MVQAPSLGSAVTVEVAFLTLPPSPDIDLKLYLYEKTVLAVSKSTTIMVQATSLRSAITVEMAFLMLSPSPDLGLKPCHLGSIALILHFTMLGQVFGNYGCWELQIWVMLVSFLTNLWRLAQWSLLYAFLNVFLEHSWAWHPSNALMHDPYVQ